MLASLMRAAASLLRLSWADARRIMRIGVVLLTVEALVRTVPLPHVVRLLGVTLAQADGSDGSRHSPTFSAEEIRLLRLVGSVVRRWPFAPRGPCLRESLVAGHLLRRHAPVLMLGAARGDASFAAHAWLRIGAVAVGSDLGYESLGTTGQAQATDGAL